uniref:outer membrane protein assembly factor BamB family protein n=1 Tax=Polynucleobacter sp. TaxID=2029855 RepID=UPI0040486490
MRHILKVFLTRYLVGFCVIVQITSCDRSQLDTKFRNAQSLESQTSQGGFEAYRYFPKIDIGAKNVQQLNIAWTFKQSNVANNQSTPIYSNGKLFVIDPTEGLVALSPTTGAVLWRRKLPGPVARRGFSIDADKLYIGTGAGTFVIDESDGAPDVSVGSGGVIQAAGTLVAPIVLKSSIIVATMGGKIKSFKKSNGELIWEFDLEKDGVRPRVWSGFSYDSQLNQLLITTSNTGQLIYSRIDGDGGFAPGIVALDASTGKLNWFYRYINHEVLDLDAVGHPIVIQRSFLESNLILQLTKAGVPLLIDSKSGELINERETRDLIQDGVFNLGSQIYYNDMLNYDDIVYEPSSEISRFDNENQEFLIHKMRHAVFGRYEPLTARNDRVLYGIHGGAEWPGGGYDPESGILFVPYNHVPWILRSFYFIPAEGEQTLDAFVQQTRNIDNCINCHGKKLEGVRETETQGDSYIPPLLGVTRKYRYANFVDPTYFKWVHKYAKKQETINYLNTEDLNSLWRDFERFDNHMESNGHLVIHGFWQYLLDKQDNPATRSDWGGIVAISLKDRKINWKTHLGENPLEDVNGDFNIGGVAIASTDLLFVTGTRDKKIRAFRKADGEMLWEYQLNFAGSAPPMLYRHDGCDYLLVNSTGGLFVGFDQGDELVAFGLQGCAAE